MDQISDTELVKLFQRGDVQAFEVFVMRHRDRLYRMSWAWLGEPNLAEDAVQETFARSYTGLAKFGFRAAPTTWLVRVCRNVCMEMARTQSRTELLGEVPDMPSDDVSIAVDQDMPQYLRTLLTALPQRQREVVVLRLLEEYSVRETAVILRCREGTVKAHLAKAMANLRRHLDRDAIDWSALGFADE